jgi:tRNA (guanine10-N2)-methyltransferase
MPLFILRVTQNHPTFRIASLLSIAQCFNFSIKFVSEDLFRGILIVELEKEEHVQHFLDRGILVMWVDTFLSWHD